MNAPRLDADLREPIAELGRREAATAPVFARVLRGRSPSRQIPAALPGWRRLALGPATLAILSAFLVVTLAWRWPRPHETTTPVITRVEPVAVAASPPQPWDVPTDGLLIDARDEAGEREVQRLSQQIEALLHP